MSSPAVEIDWPWQYSFPPFFTAQQHAETRSRQLSAWRSLVLDYQRALGQAVLDVAEAERSPLFRNQAISRQLDRAFILTILEDLARTGNAAPCDKAKSRWEIYWHTLDEWADIVHAYVEARGLGNTVCTEFELVQGEDTAGEEFHGLHPDVLFRALGVLESRRKCEIIQIDDARGVKFF